MRADKSVLICALFLGAVAFVEGRWLRTCIVLDLPPGYIPSPATALVVLSATILGLVGGWTTAISLTSLLIRWSLERIGKRQPQLYDLRYHDNILLPATAVVGMALVTGLASRDIDSGMAAIALLAGAFPALVLLFESPSQDSAPKRDNVPDG